VHPCRLLPRTCLTCAGEPVGDASGEVYPVNDVEVGPADFVAKVATPDFRAAWEALGTDGELVESFALPFKTVHEAVAAVVDLLGMVACEGTGTVKVGVTKHSALLSGVFLGDIKALARLMVRGCPAASPPRGAAACTRCGCTGGDSAAHCVAGAVPLRRCRLRRCRWTRSPAACSSWAFGRRTARWRSC